MTEGYIVSWLPGSDQERTRLIAPSTCWHDYGMWYRDEGVRVDRRGNVDIIYPGRFARQCKRRGCGHIEYKTERES